MVFFKRKSRSKRKPKPPLEDAMGYVSKAVEIAYRYKWDASFTPTESDLRAFRALSQSFESAAATAAYLTRCMERRARGEPESSERWHQPATFDYHYPP